MGVIDFLSNEQARPREVGCCAVQETKRDACPLLRGVKGYLRLLARRQVGDSIAKDLSEMLHHAAIDSPFGKSRHTLYHRNLFVVSAAHCWLASLDDKLRTRAYLQFLILLNAVLFAGVFLFPAYCAHWIASLLIGVSILAGHLFVLTHSKSSNIFFLCALIGLVILFIYNIWQQ